jgi:transcription elongation factor Elf1
MNIVDTAKSVVGLAQEVNRMDLYKQAVDLMAEVTEQQQEIMRLTEDVAALRERLRLKEELQFARNAYWAGDPAGAADGFTLNNMGPFCSRCFDVLGKAVRMHDIHETAPEVGKVFQCPECRRANAPPQLSAGSVTVG